MTEVTFVKGQNINNNACSFDGDWFYAHNEYEKCSYKSDEKAKMLYNLFDNRMTLTDIVDYFKVTSNN